MISNVTLIGFLIGCIGIVFSIIYLVVNAIKKGNKKDFGFKLMLGFIGLVVISILIQAVNASSNNNKKTSNSSTSVTKKQDNNSLSESDKALLKKTYADFSSEQRTQLAEIEGKYNRLSDSDKELIKSDIERLSKERDVQVAKWKEEEAQKQAEEAQKKAKEWQDFVNNNTKQLSAGEYNVSTHIIAGAYDITFNGSGNFNVYSKEGTLLTNEVGGSDFGISKYRTILAEGSKIKISGMSITATPVQRTLLPYSNLSLYAGYWIVGQDVTKGRYKVTPASGSGNFIIYNKNGVNKTNEILGQYGVNEVVVNLEDGDIINISSLNQVNFSPTN